MANVVENASLRPIQELRAQVISEPSAQVENKTNSDSDANQDKAGKSRKNYHSDYSDVKLAAKNLFMRFDESGVFHTHEWKIGEPLSMFVKHEVFFKKAYTEVKFMQDYAAEMVNLLSDLRIVRAVRKAELDLFSTIQVMVWDSADVKNNIHKVGIKNVNAYAEGLSWASKRDLQVFTMEQLAPIFHQLGLEEGDYNQDWSRKDARAEEAA